MCLSHQDEVWFSVIYFKNSPHQTFFRVVLMYIDTLFIGVIGVYAKPKVTPSISSNRRLIAEEK